MEIFEFISKGLKAGEKVKITLNDNTTKEYFFDGYDIPQGTRMYSIELLIPIFRKVSNNGRMLSNRVYLYLGDIANVEGEMFKGISLEEINEMNRADDIIQNRAKEILREIVKEMNSLFPGKKIFLDPEMVGTVNATIPNNYDIDAADIYSLFIKKGKVYCDVYTFDDSVQKELADLCDVDYPLLLKALTDSIKDPWLEESNGKNFAETLTSDDIPDADREKHPVLKSTFLLSFLAANLWYYEILDKNPDETNKLYPDWHKMSDDCKLEEYRLNKSEK